MGDDFQSDDGDCPNCGGEGVLYDCFDGFCVDAERRIERAAIEAGAGI